MARSIEELFREASGLPDRDRAQLAGMLIESLDHERDSGVEAAWSDEVEERVRQVDAGEVEMIPWEQVRAELFARLDDKG
jgi:putative addiction module component (TIGR02574 family)